MNKKSIVLPILILTLVIGLTGCSGNNKDASNQGAKEPSNQEQGGESSQKGKIEFFSHKKEATDTFRAIITEFNKEYPDIEVELVTVPNAQEVLISRINTGDAPDIFTVQPLGSDYKAFVKENYLVDLTNEPFMKNANEQIVSMSKIDSKDYSLPIALNTTGIFYNKDIFKKNGLEIPKTYVELIETMKKLKDAGVTPMLFPDKDAWTIGAFAERTIGLFVEDKGELFEKVAKGEESVVNSEAMRKLAEQILELRQYGQPDTLGTGYDQAVASFANGEAAMFYQGTWALPLIKKANPNLNFAMFPYPAETSTGLKMSVNIDNAVSIYSEGKNVELSKLFVEFLSKTSSAQEYADMDGSPSGINGVKLNTEEFKEVQQQIEQGQTFRLPGTYWADGVVGDFRNLLQNMIMDKDVDKFLLEMDKVIIERYAE